ncbi:MerR family transcriptional regulator [Lentzea sp. NPDC058450]|uniref:MerR family transcriptional regulator n=1 Tax=Lentzea sp. NPDC058450 TaxID=3346505 RepID=UPI0036601456
MNIGALAERTGVKPRLLRYYEEVGILHPVRSPNGYRTYGEPAVGRVLQIREMIESGLTTDMIREVLPCMEAAKTPQDIEMCPASKDLDGLRKQLAGIERRLDVLQRNRDAIKAYLSAWEKTLAAKEKAARQAG